MSFQIKKATRQGVKPLIGLFSESGCGKSFSALLLARGLVGPSGHIVQADSESGRGSLYADVIPGGYDTVEITAPFSSRRYVEVIKEVESSGAQVGILDSASHEWEGIDGVLDQAMQNEENSGKPGLHCWRTPKLEHAKFMLALLQSPIPWIVCLRAKHKSRQTKDERGKTVIIKDEFTTPIQAEDFIFEMTAHAEILPDHSIRLTKCSHPSLAECFPKQSPITIANGEALARWCSAPGKVSSVQPSLETEQKALKAKLWAVLAPVRGPEKNWESANEWLWNNGLLIAGQLASSLTAEELAALIPKVQEKLAQPVNA